MQTEANIDFQELAILARKAQLGDSAAYEVFLTTLYPFVRMVIRSRLGGRVDVDDLTQESLMGVHKSLASYHPSRELKPWIRAIIRYKMVDYFRAQARRHEVELSENVEEVTNEGGGTNRVERGSEDYARARELVERLSEPMRQALMATKYEGLSCEEAAHRQGITPAALRKRLSRAYRELARMLDKELDAEGHGDKE